MIILERVVTLSRNRHPESNLRGEEEKKKCVFLGALCPDRINRKVEQQTAMEDPVGLRALY